MVTQLVVALTEGFGAAVSDPMQASVHSLAMCHLLPEHYTLLHISLWKSNSGSECWAVPWEKVSLLVVCPHLGSVPPASNGLSCSQKNRGQQLLESSNLAAKSWSAEPACKTWHNKQNKQHQCQGHLECKPASLSCVTYLPCITPCATSACVCRWKLECRQI